MEEGVGIFRELDCPGLLVSNVTRLALDKIDLGCGIPAAHYSASVNPCLALLRSHPEGVEAQVELPGRCR